MMIQKILILFIFIGTHSAYALEINQRIANSGSSQKQKITTKAIRYKKSFHTYSNIPDIDLVDEDGKTINLLSFINSNQPVFLDFIFTSCPTFCPILSATFSKVQALMPDERPQPKFISISIDPEKDTSKQLKAYANKFHAGPDWIFLTGKYEDIITVQQSFSAYGGDKMNHKALVFIHINKHSNWLRLEGFSSAKDLISEYTSLIAKGHRSDAPL